jgi:hypothetical protein
MNNTLHYFYARAVVMVVCACVRVYVRVFTMHISLSSAKREQNKSMCARVHMIFSCAAICADDDTCCCRNMKISRCESTSEAAVS